MNTNREITYRCFELSDEFYKQVIKSIAKLVDKTMKNASIIQKARFAEDMYFGFIACWNRADDACETLREIMIALKIDSAVGKSIDFQHVPGISHACGPTIFYKGDVELIADIPQIIGYITLRD